MTSDSCRVARAALLGGAVVVTLLGAPAGAQDWSAGEWRYRAQVYGWLPTDVPDGLGAERNQRLGLSLAGPPGQLQLRTAEAGTSGWSWSLAGDLPIVDEPRYELHVLGGVRQLTLDAGPERYTRLDAFPSLSVGYPVPALGSTVTGLPSIWDGVVGAHGRVRLGDGGWFLPYYVDVGTGQSELTWQAMGGIGYTFSWGEVVGGYRHLDYRFQPGSAYRDMTFSGPGLSLGVRW
jgi:hypothetical protein